eukprot:2808072-Pleurochrysis_carterae.AAC.2
MIDPYELKTCLHFALEMSCGCGTEANTKPKTEKRHKEFRQGSVQTTACGNDDGIPQQRLDASKKMNRKRPSTTHDRRFKARFLNMLGPRPQYNGVFSAYSGWEKEKLKDTGRKRTQAGSGMEIVRVSSEAIESEKRWRGEKKKIGQGRGRGGAATAVPKSANSRDPIKLVA